MRRCSFDGCEKPYCAKGLCNSHWAQQRRGNPLTPIVTHETIEDRFDRNIEKQNNGCWIWLGAGSGKYYQNGEGGYGQLRHGGKSWMAHRWSYEQRHGVKLATDDTLDHICRNTRCVNPEHLEKVTLAENIKRMHLYRALKSENERLKSFLSNLGYDVDKVLGGDSDADVPSISQLQAFSRSS